VALIKTRRIICQNGAAEAGYPFDDNFGLENEWFIIARAGKALNKTCQNERLLFQNRLAPERERRQFLSTVLLFDTDQIASF
jgi:hypothetical protein